MNALDMNLAAAVEKECSILQFREDHEAKNERLDAMMMKEATEARKRIKVVRKAGAEEVARIDAQIAELVALKAEIQCGTAEQIAAENRRIAKCKAYIAAE